MAFIRPLRAWVPKMNMAMEPSSFFGRMKHLYADYVKRGLFEQAPEAAYYVYRQSDENGQHTGLICLTHISEYQNGNVRKHENTIAAKERKQLKMHRERGALIKPVLLTHPDVAEVQAILNKWIKKNDVFFETSFDNGSYQIWAIDNPKTVAKLTELYREKVPYSYIADGHHRASTIEQLYTSMRQLPPEAQSDEYEYMLSVFVPSSELSIYDYNRVVNTLNDMQPIELMARLSRVGVIEPLYDDEHLPSEKHEVGMFLLGRWYAIKWHKHIIKQYKTVAERLDVSILNDVVLGSLLGITDVRNDTRLTYVPGTEGAAGLERRVMAAEGDSVAFKLYPMSIEDLMLVSDQQGVLPPKSTYFLPRIKNGMVVYRYA